MATIKLLFPEPSTTVERGGHKLPVTPPEDIFEVAQYLQSVDPMTQELKAELERLAAKDLEEQYDEVEPPQAALACGPRLRCQNNLSRAQGCAAARVCFVWCERRL